MSGIFKTFCLLPGKHMKYFLQCKLFQAATIRVTLQNSKILEELAVAVCKS